MRMNEGDEYLVIGSKAQSKIKKGNNGAVGVFLEKMMLKTVK